MTVQYLIDSENIGDFWIPLLELPADRIQLIVFYTRNSPHMSYDSLIRLKESNLKVTFIKCYEGTNALDFQLVSELGYRISKDEDGKFVIVTNDTGFDAAVKYWRRRKKSVKRITGRECRNPERRIREDLTPVRSAAGGTLSLEEAFARETVRQPVGADHGDEHDAHVDAWHAENAVASADRAASATIVDQDARPSRPNLRDAESAAQPEPEEEFPVEDDIEMPDPEMELYDADTEEDGFAEDSGQEFEYGGEDLPDADIAETTAGSQEDFPEETTGSGEDFPEEIAGSGEDFPEETAGSGEDLAEETTGSGEDFPEEAAGSGGDLAEEAAGSGGDLAEKFAEEADLPGLVADTDPAEEADLFGENADPDTDTWAKETDLSGEDTADRISTCPLADVEDKRPASADSAADTGAEASRAPDVFESPAAFKSAKAPESPAVLKSPEAPESPAVFEAAAAFAGAAPGSPNPAADRQVLRPLSEQTEEIAGSYEDARAAEEQAMSAPAAFDEAEEEEEPAPRSRSRRSRSRRSRSGSRKQEQTPVQEEVSESPEQETTGTADREKKGRGKKESADKKEADLSAGAYPDDEEIARIVACIGPDNLAELHNQLATFYGDLGKEIYLSIKNNSRRLPALKPDSAQKFAYYCEIIFARSDAADEYPSDISEYLLTVREKLNNLNSLRYALQKHYGKEKGRRYYFLLKPFAKTMYQM